MRTRTRIALGFSAVAVVALIGWMVRPEPVAVEVVAATKGTFEQTIVEDGKTRVRERYTVSAPLAGRLARISLRVGDPVEQGQVVAVLTPSMPAFLDARAEGELIERVGAAEAQRLRAHAEILKTQVQLKQAMADRDRAARLAREGFLSAAVREQAEFALQTAERAVDVATFSEHAAEHDEAQARAALARYRAAGSSRPAQPARWEVRSPVAGSVLKILQESEAVVPLGAMLLEIANPRSLEATVDVLSQDSTNLVPGMEAHVELGPDARALAARIRNIEPAAFTKVSALGIEEQRVNVILDFVGPLERVRTIGDGFRVDAQIVTFRSEAAVKLRSAHYFAMERNGPYFWSIGITLSNGRSRSVGETQPRR